VDKKGPVNYGIEVENGMQKVYHINVLKEFVRRHELWLKTGHSLTGDQKQKTRMKRAIGRRTQMNRTIRVMC